MTEHRLSHLDADGNAHMVDVGDKAVTRRRAVARGVIAMKPETTAAILNNGLPKGDVLAVARIAGIQAAKKTSDLIPLCHPLMLTSVSVDLVVRDGAVEIEATVETTGQTGVEMEALTACSVAALTLYDMCKAIDKTMEIGQIALWEKSGGRSVDISR
jgi:cyclic pyranopterin monophosphate synthase